MRISLDLKKILMSMMKLMAGDSRKIDLTLTMALKKAICVAYLMSRKFKRKSFHRKVNSFNNRKINQTYNRVKMNMMK